MLSQLNSHHPFIVGITGGIASGKTTVSNMFAKLGVEIIDADVISRKLLAADGEARQAVIAYFGERVLDQGKLDRSKLRDIIFSEPEAKAWLEALMHPLIRDAIICKINNSPRQWLLLSAPLLLETDDYDFVDAIVVVDTPEPQQVSRAVKRDDAAQAEVHKIMAAQLSRATRLLRADHIIYNDSDLSYLHTQVSKLFKHFEERANARN